MAQITSLPRVTGVFTTDSRAILSVPQRILVIGQKNGGTAISGALIQNIANGGAEDALVGANSRLGGCIRAIKVVNQETQLDAISLDDNGVALATGTIAITGTQSTEAGTYVFNIASRENHSYSIPVALNDTPTIVGDALVAAITADTKVPVTAVNTSGSVAITAVNAGTMGNFIGLEVQEEIAGLTVAVTVMASGATDPVLTNIFDVIGEQRYQTIIFPSEYGFDFITDYLDPKLNVDNIFLIGDGYCGKTDTLSNLKTAANAENSQNLKIFGNQLVSDTFYKGSAMFELDDVRAGYFGGWKALKLTAGANITSRISARSSGTLDRVGGISQNSYPFFNTPFPELPLIDLDRGFSQSEISELNDAGLSVEGNNSANTEVLLGEVVTVYKTDAQSNPDTTFKFENVKITTDAINEYFFNNLKADFDQSRATQGDLTPNAAMTNPNKMRAAMTTYYKRLGDLLLVEKGETSRNFFNENLTVTLDSNTGKFTVTGKVIDIIQLREIDYNFKVTFQAT